MNQIHLALAHYWHLRCQEVEPATAAAHVKQRFGVDLDAHHIEDNARKRARLVGASAPSTKVYVTANPQGLMGTA